MPTIDQILRDKAKRHPDVPYWVLEKDFALSYLLAGIAQIEILSKELVIKGGTALRKFYFPDYRFSEDLDFTSRPEMQIHNIDTAMHEAVDKTVQLLQRLGPFDAQIERLTLRTPHPEGQDAFTIRVRFPTHREYLCRLKVEITHDEILTLPTPQKTLLHRYAESPPQTKMFCYTLEEIVAEKLRALLQSYARLQARGWGASRVCRDYYDLWYILNEYSLEPSLLPDLLLNKCALKSITLNSSLDFFAIELLNVARTEWNVQLCPFVSNCPEVEQVLSELYKLVMDINFRSSLV